MRLQDLTVEVRNKAFQRVGAIRHEELNLEVTDDFNNVGAWKLRLAAEHPLANELRQPGSGLIVTGPTDVILSGPTITPEFAITPEDPGGSISFTGVSDSVTLVDMLSFPDPTNPDPTTQELAHDIRSGVAETVMHAYVSANIGPSAPAERRRAGLVMGEDLGRGPIIKKSPRFPALGELLAEIAAVAGLGFRIVQRGSVPVFETYDITDRTATVRLDVRNNTLAGQRVAISAPGVTRAIVAGQGDLTERQFVAVSTPEAQAAEAQWGRRIERFIDQRNTNDWDELTQAGEEVMAEEGYTSISVQAVPTEDSLMRFGIDWGLGDKVSVVIENQELSSTVTGVVLKADPDGLRVGTVIGQPTGLDLNAALSKRVTNTERRISALERNVLDGVIDPDAQVFSFMGVW
ncbi:siphovirus ReqiPepy6 Gp37-like family protein [Streptomyces smyrnaeus]|uniref:siphovirus ReqiPepy6 Gp37-like family protein n=1 Tax=Streptomyces smyrnaeus TaxID=1387713 RepID=UPI0033AE8B43